MKTEIQVQVNKKDITTIKEDIIALKIENEGLKKEVEELKEVNIKLEARLKPIFIGIYIVGTAGLGGFVTWLLSLILHT